MSDTMNLSPSASENAISITALIRTSYKFFSSHFRHFLKLAALPILVWVLVELFRDYLLFEYGLIYDSRVANGMASAAFVLVWYRKFLMGDQQATYSHLFDNVISPGVFNILFFFKFIARIVIVTAILVVPALIISLCIMGYHLSQGEVINAALLNEIIMYSTLLAIFFFSPVMVRLSFYGVGVAVGRKEIGYREVWKKTKGYTWELWHLLLRAVLPVGMYNYFLTNAFKKIAYQWELDYIWASLLINIPAAFFTFMMLAIVVVANGGAYKQLFGIRTEQRL